MNIQNYFKKAQKGKWAIGQFNFSTVEQLRGILRAAEKMKSPVILGTSEGESEFLGLKETIALVEISKMKYKVSVFLNIDHGQDLKKIKRAIDLGYPMVHFDGSKLSFEENIKKTKEIVIYAHKKGVSVEGELGHIGGASQLHKVIMKVDKADLTPPEQVAEFVKRTGVDILAISIGSSHGVFKKGPDLDFKRLEAIQKVAKCPLVLHGGSGISSSKIKKAIKLGVSKINVNTELRIAWRDSLQKTLNKTKEYKPYKILPEAEKAVQKKVEEKILLFGSKNKK